MRRHIPDSTWAEIRTAFAAGLGLRELARNAGIPAGTVLSRSKREGWMRQIREAKALVPPHQQSDAITPMQSAALSMQERGQRHVERMADLTDRVMPHVEGMSPETAFERMDRVDKFDRVARRTYGIDADKGYGGGLLGILLTLEHSDSLTIDAADSE